MFSFNQVQRLLEAESYGRVIERILANGRCSSSVRKRLLARLDSPVNAAIAAHSLALQRFCELSYGPSLQHTSLAARVLEAQRPDGLWGRHCTAGEEDAPCIATSAVAVAGLMLFNELNRSERLEQAIDRALAALRAGQDGCGMIRGDVVGSAVVLWQLGATSRFRLCFGAERRQRLAESLHNRTSADTDSELARYANAMAA